MPGTVMEVDVCVCFSNNCNGKQSSIGVADEEKESSHGEMIHYPKLYIPSTLNIDLILWHTQLIACAENVKSWF